MHVKHQFVLSFPSPMEAGTLYVSMEYASCGHLCACGCGREVVTPLRPKDAWTLTFDGEAITLSPSIGSRNLPCRSHYYIRNGKVVWLRKMDEYDEPLQIIVDVEPEAPSVEPSPSKGWLERLMFWNR